MPALKQRAESAAHAGPPPSLVLEGPSDAVAAATLQNRVQDMAGLAGTTLVSVENLPVEAVGTAYHRIGLKISLNASWPVLIALLKSVEQATPPMLLDDVQIHGSPLPMLNQNRGLEANFTIYGLRAGSAGGAQAMSRQLLLGLLGALAVLLALTIGYEIFAPNTDEAGIAAPAAAHAAAPAASPANRGAAGAQTASWVGAILARPLFSVSRKPDGGPATAAAAASDDATDLPRLTGVLMYGTTRHALFQPVGDVPPLVVGEGELVAGWNGGRQDRARFGHVDRAQGRDNGRAEIRREHGAAATADAAGGQQAGRPGRSAWQCSACRGAAPPECGPARAAVPTPGPRSADRRADSSPLHSAATIRAAKRRAGVAAGSPMMVLRRTLTLAVSALALAACQHEGATLALLPSTADPNAGVATPRQSGIVAAEPRSQPEPELSLGANSATTKPHLPPGSATGDVQLNFADTDIREIARQVLGTILQVNYSIDPAVHGTATIETAKPLKREELLPTLELLLNQNGASLVQSGTLYRVLPSSTAVATPALAEAQTTGSESVTLRYASAKDLAKVLEPFVAEGARITPDANRNVLLISGEPAARRTIESLIASFDTDILAGQSFAIFPVTEGEPGKIAAEMQKALQTEGDSALSGVLRVIPMDRANAVLVISSQRRYIASAERLFHLIEKTRKDTERSWHVYYIQNGQANDVANVLQRAFTPNNVTAKPDSTGSTAPGQGSSTIGGSSSGQSGFGNSSSGALGSSTSGLGSTGATNSSSGPRDAIATRRHQDRSGSSAFGSPSSSNDSASTESLSASTQQSGGQANAIRIIPNKQNNALLIFATPEEESSVESMLHKIDIIPLQVRIDATIAEVDLNDTLQYGTQFYFQNKALTGALTQAVTSAPTAANIATSSFANFSGFSLSNGGDVRFVLQALQKVTNVRVLSSPQLMVLDNQTAQLQVGDSVPYNTGSIETGVSTGTTGSLPPRPSATNRRA